MIDPSFFESSIFPLLLLIVVAVILFKILRGVAEWRHNTKQPILTVDSIVISKRTKKSRHMHNLKGDHHVISDYYATFVIENGEQKEFVLTGKEYSQIDEGDEGKLTYQGTRYDHFEKIKK